MTAQLAALTRLGLGMRDITDAFTLSPQAAGLREGATRPVERVGLMASAEDVTTPPIVRVVMALLYADSLGIALSPDQRALVDWVRRSPWPSFGRSLTAYEHSGRPSSF